MKPILGADAAPVLENAARGRALIVFDFDGTLAPIVPDREAAGLRDETLALLRAVALLYPCAVVSGRARGDVSRRLHGVPLVAIVGNHGAEAGYGPLDRTRRDRILRWKRTLEEVVRDRPGLDLEDKHFSLAVHYRHAPSRSAAHRLIVNAAPRLEAARVIHGHAVVNFVPADSPDKGTAVEEIRRRLAPREAVYVGDDLTDEDAFRDPRIEVTVRVGRTARSLARFYLPSQASIDAFLCALLAARRRLDGLGDGWSGLCRTLGFQSLRGGARP